MRTWIAGTSLRLPSPRRFSGRFSGRSSWRSCGFTLIELSLVIFIVGLLLLVAVPRLGSLGGVRLETSAKRLAALARYLHAEAALRSRVYRLNYDLDQRRYWVSVLAASAGSAEFVADTAMLTRPVALPQSIRFAEVQVPQIGRVSSGQVYTHFYPHGDTDPTIIHLQGREAESMTILIPPMGGNPEVVRGYANGFIRQL